MMHKALCNIEEVPYNFSGSSIKFWGHTGWKIDVSNPIWVRLLGRSQLSNPSDLPCFNIEFPIEGLPTRFLPDSQTTTIRVFISFALFLPVSDCGLVDSKMLKKNQITMLGNVLLLYDAKPQAITWTSVNLTSMIYWYPQLYIVMKF